MITQRTFAIATLLAAALLLVLAWPTAPSVVDDAWISARYARSLALGHGLVYDAGQPPIEGFTNLAWTLMLALASRIGASLQATMISAGLVGGVLSVFASAAIAQEIAHDRDGRVSAVALLAPFGLALDPHLAVVTTNGLESSLFLAAVLGTTWAVIAERRGLGVLFAIATITLRPEGAAVVAVLATLDLARGVSKPEHWAIAGAGAVTLAAITLFRIVVYGALLPNTFAAKAGKPLAERLAFDLAYLRPDGGFWMIGLGVALFGQVLAWRTGARVAATAVGSLVILLVAVAFSVDMWMPGGRLLLAPLALAWSLFAGALARVRLPLVRIAGLVIAADLVLLPITPWARVVRAADVAHSAQPGNDAERAARWLGDQLPAGAWLVTRDAGVLAYFVGDHVHVAEIHPRALTQPHPGGRDLDPRDVVPERPELVVLTVEDPHARALFYEMDRAVFGALREPYTFLGRVRQHHQRYYDVWARTDLALPALPEDLRVGSLEPPYPAPSDLR
ncbi:hypothetical protein [Sandaracinus amylolyticus]|uniref:hypothetical protein n=1 Tax=Sandaracinus amylolyticus TaxID=927083 RepID=UPI001F1DBBC9|nr:hypothetical protein [Sandaracinus amylolyticus]UJR82309.1 Hypothetical protein I5071_43740 [Sandaracinus amylolyticus]